MCGLPSSVVIGLLVTALTDRVAFCKVRANIVKMLVMSYDQIEVTQIGESTCEATMTSRSYLGELKSVSVE